jgi:hypothetical protein
VGESQTAESALRDDWTRNVPHHTLEVVLEVILEHMCTGLIEGPAQSFPPFFFLAGGPNFLKLSEEQKKRQTVNTRLFF